MTPGTFLVASLPAEGKVVYSKMKNGQSLAKGRMFPIVDGGLLMPHGIAIDKLHGLLYVADPQQKSIFQYKLSISGDELSSDGVQLLVMGGREVHWVTCDRRGDLFFTDGPSRQVLKMTWPTIDGLMKGKFLAGDLTTIKQEEEEELAAAAAAEAREFSGKAKQPKREAVPEIYTLYEAADNPHVSFPGGIASDDIHIFFSNEKRGGQAGSVVEGEVDPKAPLTGASEEGPQPFSSTQLASNTDNAFGVALTFDKIIYTDDTENVWGMPINGGSPVKMAGGLVQPRGLAWDGDSTMFVADTQANSIKAFPVGQLRSNGLDGVTAVHSAWGLAILTARDPGWAKIGGSTGGAAAHGFAVPLLLALTTVAAAWVGVER